MTILRRGARVQRSGRVGQHPLSCQSLACLAPAATARGSRVGREDRPALLQFRLRPDRARRGRSTRPSTWTTCSTTSAATTTIAAEELLAAIFRNNQESKGHVGGFANWGVYTPGMLYAVGQHYLLSGDRASFERLLPPTLKPLDWCLSRAPAPLRGRPRQQVWSAPVERPDPRRRSGHSIRRISCAGLEMLGRALADIRTSPRRGVPRGGRDDAQVRRRSRIRQGQRAAPRGTTARSYVDPLRAVRCHDARPADRTGIPPTLTPGPSTSRGSRPSTREARSRPPAQRPRGQSLLQAWGMANEPVYNQQATAYLLAR